MTRESGTAIHESGTLIGVGVGPGDPGLVTVRAIEVIQQTPTVAFPVHKEGGGSRAYDAVASHLRRETALLPLLMPMTRDRDKLERAHAAAAAAIAAAAAGRRDVAYLSLGDPLFYSTFGYLAKRFPGRVEVVSGVTAASATAAALGLPLAAGDTPTVVVTGKAHAALAAALAMAASVIVIKPRSLSPESLDLLDRSGAWKRARAAVELGGPGERLIEELDRETAADLPYFAVLWIQPE
jgi:precorrin-2/cobalt-factor-2 C20-methyltransferase